MNVKMNKFIRLKQALTEKLELIFCALIKLWYFCSYTF